MAIGRSYFADLRMTFRQKVSFQNWFRNKLGVGLGLGLRLELVFGIGLVLVKPLLCYVWSLLGQRNNLLSSGNLYTFIRSNQEELRKMQL